MQSGFDLYTHVCTKRSQERPPLSTGTSLPTTTTDVVPFPVTPAPLPTGVRDLCTPTTHEVDAQSPWSIVRSSTERQSVKHLTPPPRTPGSCVSRPRSFPHCGARSRYKTNCGVHTPRSSVVPSTPLRDRNLTGVSEPAAGGPHVASRGDVSP